MLSFMHRWIGLLLVLLMLAACGTNNAPPPQSDARGTSWNVSTFGGDLAVDVDRAYYRIEGEVIGELRDLERYRSSSSFTAVNGVASGSSWSETDGKGFVRVRVSRIEPAAPHIGTVEQVLLLKSTDSKIKAVLPGDRVTFICRANFEAVAPVLVDQVYTAEDKEQGGVWEFDYCRMDTPQLGVPDPTPTIPKE